jgi:hypothetical protein
MKMKSLVYPQSLNELFSIFIFHFQRQPGHERDGLHAQHEGHDGDKDPAHAHGEHVHAEGESKLIPNGGYL